MEAAGHWQNLMMTLRTSTDNGQTWSLSLIHIEMCIRDRSNEETARYMEYKNTGEGANVSEWVAWSKQLTKKEGEAVTVDAIFSTRSNWNQVD